MMKYIGWLVFIKIVLQAVKRFKKGVIKKKRLKKDYDKKDFDKKEEIKKDCEKPSS